MGEFTFHYTDRDGYNAIRSQVVWTFRAQPQRGDRPRGAYFTPLILGTLKLAKRLRIPVSKTEFVFCFVGASGLETIRGGRSEHVLFCPDDYTVEVSRQRFHGERERSIELFP